MPATEGEAREPGDRDTPGDSDRVMPGVTALSTMDDRRPICLMFTGNGWTHAWLSTSTTPEVVERVLVALAEVGLTPDRVAQPVDWPVKFGGGRPPSKPFLRYDRTLTVEDRDMIEKAVRLAHMPMACGRDPERAEGDITVDTASI